MPRDPIMYIGQPCERKPPISFHDYQMFLQTFLQGKIPVYNFQSLISFYIKQFLCHFDILKKFHDVTICERICSIYFMLFFCNSVKNC